MDIGVPDLQRIDGRPRVSSTVRAESASVTLPDAMWFSARGDAPPPLTRLADPFVIAAAPVAMTLGENLRVRGPVSERLAHGLAVYLDILNTWWPKLYRKIEIDYDDVRPRRDEPRPAGVGCCFSGGVDSFHAVMSLRRPHQKFAQFEISHAVMINGFDQINDVDADGAGAGASRRLFEIYRAALAAWDIDLLMIDTNVKQFRDAAFEKRALVTSFGNPLTACAHALAPSFGRFSLSGHATYAYADLKPLGSHPALDHNLSSDQLQIIHTGADASRTAKLESLIESPEVRSTLRVCFGDPQFDPETGGVRNCGQCEKCVRTIVSLDILGELDRFPTFTSPYEIAAYKEPRVLTQISAMFFDDVIDLARRKNRADWLAALGEAKRQLAASRRR